jgi:Gpi18-like mannosyltransferase
MRKFPSRLEFGGIVALFLIGISLRGLFIPAISADMQWSFFAMYDFYKSHGAQGLGIRFSTYSPPYLYLIWLATFTSSYIPKILAIKLISITADIINTILVYRIVRLKFPTGVKPLVASALFWILPTVMINSSLWGQVDAIYMTLVLACVYFLLKDKPLLGVCVFGAAFAIKAQAFFIFPFLIILFFKKRILWWHFLLIPMIYVLLYLPAVLLGGSLWNVFSVYFYQSSFYHELSRHAPNLYIFMNSFPYDLGVTLGLAITVIALSCWIGFTVGAISKLSQNTIVFTGLMSVALVPFLLPKMLDRYFYPADILALIAAFYLPELWFIPILYQIISTSAYLVSLFDAPLLLIKVAALLNAATIFSLVWKQVRTIVPTSLTQTPPKESST